MLLPPQFQDPLLKTLGPPIRKAEENKPKEVKVRDGIYRVNGKLETRIPDYFSQRNWDFIQQQKKNEALSAPVVIEPVSEVDIPLPEFKIGDRVRLKESDNGLYIFDETRCPPGTLATITDHWLITDNGVRQLYINECLEHV